MNLRTIALVFVASTATVVFAADGNFDKTLSVSGPATVSVSTGSGYIHVYPGSDNQVHIIGHVHSRNGLFGNDADGAVKKIVDAPPIQQSGNTITIGKTDDDEHLFRNVSIDYDVTTPASTTLKARSGSGSLEIGGIQGEVAAGTGSGGIHVDNIGANARLETGSGSIKATNVHGGATARTGSGGIELAMSAPGEMKADTGSGSIHVSGTPTSSWTARTGSGSVTLEVPADAKFNLDADTGSGGVKVDRPIVMQGSLNKHHVSGAVNGGGPIVHVSTGSGSVTVQ
jgi:DUF4097 and DUF4098 domain-containing protein YvlB